ncbi:hypothetical protein OSB04_004173 [Centaurea solstitialis]|uniref:Uncharacterized protein n=1 Tax=Centaurea solstitialis TaxID=347529 RepID=A0AA38WPJ2_9ASTR|nr:hypothetical protein OSB04_004173 [Centaurea solstitialis]
MPNILLPMQFDWITRISARQSCRFNYIQHGVGSLSESKNVSAVMQSIGNAGVWTQQVVNDVIITSWQSESSSSQPESNTQPESSSLPVQCEVCNITCNSEDVLEKHKNGKKHLKNLQKLAITSLFAPKMPPPAAASAPSVGVLEDKKHKLLQNAPSVGVLEDKKHKLLQNGASVDALIYCDICNVVCNNQDVFRTHLAGKKHSAKATARLANVNETCNSKLECNPEAQPSNEGSQMKPNTIQPAAATCELCKITCTSTEGLNVHLIGKKHLKKLQESQQIPNLPLIPATGNVEPAEATTRIANVYEISNPTSQCHPEAQPSNGSSHLKPDTIQFATCELCKITCTNNEDLSVHLIGKKHLKKVKESQQSGIPTTENVEPAEGEGKSVISHEEKSSWCELCGINCTTYDALQSHISGKKHQKKLEMSQKPIGPNPAPGAVQNTLKEEGKIVKVDSGNRKVKRVGDDGDLEAKKQKVLQGGVQTCTVCNVVCNSPTVFISHLAGQKHAAMAVKQAEARSNGQET